LPKKKLPTGNSIYKIFILYNKTNKGAETPFNFLI